MINKITIIDSASFKNKTEVELNKVNFFYGGNGTGKTTISKVLNGDISSPNCKIESIGNYKTVVYNKPFVDLHFNNSSKVKGIYTLGSDSIEQQKIIKDKMDLLNSKNEKLMNYKNSIDKNNETIENTQNEISDICWNYKKEVYSVLKYLLKGRVGNKNKFKEYILESLKKEDSNLTIDDITIKYKKLFNEQLTEMDLLNTISLFDMGDINGILNTPIIGNADSMFAPMIEKLSNADWVKKGWDYLEESDGYCPYCQQKLPLNFKDKLLEFFNEGYEKQMTLLKNENKHSNSAIKEISNQMNHYFETYSNILI